MSIRRLPSAVSPTLRPVSLRTLIRRETAIGNVPSALRWLRSTFLFVRIHKNRAYYGLDVDGTSPEQRLEEFCLAAIEQLVQSGLVERDGEDLAANRAHESLQAGSELHSLTKRFDRQTSAMSVLNFSCPPR